MKDHFNSHTVMKYGGGGGGGVYFVGFIGALVYFLHYHSDNFWLIILAFLKAAVWPAFFVYNIFQFLKM